MTSKGEKINIKKLHLNEDEILAKIPLIDGPGRCFSISEATGNEGASKELWYHRGAVILWPKDRGFDLAIKMDIDYGICFFKEYIKENNVPKGDGLEKITRLAEHIINNQPSYNDEDISRELIAIGDIDLIKRFLHKKMMAGYDLSHIDTKTFIRIVEYFGWRHFVDGLCCAGAQIRGDVHGEIPRRLTPTKPECEDNDKLHTDDGPQRAQMSANIIDLVAVTSHPRSSRYPRRQYAE